MKKEYDFEQGKRGSVIAPQGKTRITIYLDDAFSRNSETERRRLVADTRR